MNHFDTIIIGAGAAGLFCGIHASSEGKRVLVADHAKRPGEKIRISGGGRCNFTNLHCRPENFIGNNPHFAKSALARFTQHDFLDLVNENGIAWHEKKLGQLFCDGKSNQIVDMLVDGLDRRGGRLQLSAVAERIARTEGGFEVDLNGKTQRCENLVIATGGKSIPKMGATGFGYSVAKQFGLAVTETRPALVPFTFNVQQLEETRALAGIALDVRVACNGTQFEEAVLYTHRGLSGPAALQISSYWREGDTLTLELAPGRDAEKWLADQRTINGKLTVAAALSNLLPARFAKYFIAQVGLSRTMADLSNGDLKRIAGLLDGWSVKPAGTEGYRTAEVTLGGVDTDELSSRTMEAKKVPGLYFIGEVVDVTGWLGGYNFQWAWSSAWAAGTHLGSI